MKKAVKRIVLCLTVLSLLGFQAMVPCSAGSSELLSYGDAIEHLGSISLTDENELDLIYRSFEAIGSRYFAPQYLYLTGALLDLFGNEDVDFDRIEIALTILKSNSAFIESYTANESLAYLPLDSLLDYVQARKLEAEGKLDEAYQAYISNQILDSLDRAIANKLQLSKTPEPAPSTLPTSTLLRKALLTPEELLAMPAVGITYYLTEGGDPQFLAATPTLSPLGKAYWVMLPPEAFSFPMTLTITASEIAPYTFSPMTGDALITDPATIDYDGWSTLITAYQNDIMVDTYRLYVSTVEMPLVVEPAEVPVYYVDAENNANVLYYEVVLAYYDQDNIITVNTGLVPANYTLAGDSSAAVTVNETGLATPEWVTFYFQAQAMQGTLHIYYTDAYGTELASSQTQTLDPGTYTITPNPSDLPSGYALSPENPAQAEVTVDSLGNTSPGTVTFVYEQQIVTGILTVYYTDDNGATLAPSETLELATGSHTVTPNTAIIPSGYVLTGTAQYTVNVDSSGSVSPASVTFVYMPEQVEPVTGTLTIQYHDTLGAQIAAPQTETLPIGTHTIAIDAASIPSGYALDASSPAQFTVTVDENGSVSPSTVTFILAAVPAETPTLSPVESFAVTNTSAVNFRSSPDTSSADNITFPSVDQGTQVWVYGTFVLDGREWASISYSSTDCYVWYSLIDLVTETSAPVSGSLTVRYQTAGGAEVAADQILTLVPGAYTVVPEASHVPAGYVLAAGTPAQFTVTVDGSGVTSPASVTFTFEAQTEEPTPTPAPTPTLGAPADISATYPDYTVIDASAVTNATGVRFRSTPSTASADNILYQVPEATAVWVHGVFTADETQWAFIRYENADCYVWYSLITLDEPIATPTPSLVPTDTPTATPEATPTQTPLLGEPEDITATYPDYTAIGAAAQTNATGVRFRSAPDTASTENILFQVSQGTEVWVHGSFTVGDTQWAYIEYERTDCYVWQSLINIDSSFINHEPDQNSKSNSRLLSDIPFTSASSKNGGFQYYSSITDNFGTKYNNGIGGTDRYGTSWQEYDVTNYKYIEGRIILDYDARTQTNEDEYLWIYGDDINIYMSPEIKAGIEAVDFKIEISDVRKMKIEISGRSMIRLVDCVLYETENGSRFSSAEEGVQNTSADPTLLASLDWYNASYEGGGFNYYNYVKDNFGNTYANGLGGQSGYDRNFQSFKIDGQYEKMTGTIVLNYDARTMTNDDIFLWIYGDDKLLYRSPPVNAGVEPIHFKVSLKTITYLRVEIEGTSMLRLVDCALYRLNGTKTYSSCEKATIPNTSKIYLSNLDWYNASYESGGFDYYNSVKDNFGNTYANGLGGKSGYDKNFQTYKINSQYAKMIGTVVLNYDAITQTDDDVFLWIYGDDKLLFKSPLITTGVQPEEFEVPLEGVIYLRVEIDGTSMLRLVDCILFK